MPVPKARILLVDDERLIQRMGRFILENSQYEVHLAGDGTEAIRVAREIRPDLILLDIQLPHLDGFEVLQILKGSPDTQAIPVVFMSSLAEVADRARGMKLGASGYITKPFQPAHLLTVVTENLQ